MTTLTPPLVPTPMLWTLDQYHQLIDSGHNSGTSCPERGPKDDAV